MKRLEITEGEAHVKERDEHFLVCLMSASFKTTLWKLSLSTVITICIPLL